MDFRTLCMTALCSVAALFLIAKIMGHTLFCYEKMSYDGKPEVRNRKAR